MRLAPVAAAIAVATIGLGSLLSFPARLADDSVATAPETMNLSTALRTVRAIMNARIVPRPPGSLRGGPVISQQ